MIVTKNKRLLFLTLVAGTILLLVPSVSFVCEFREIVKDSSVVEEFSNRQLAVTRRWCGFGRVVEVRFFGAKQIDLSLDDTENLAKLDSIELLDLSETSFSSGNLHRFCRLKNLKVLLLNDTNIDDGSIGMISDLGQLRKLDISNTEISRQGFLTIQTRLPDTEIFYY